MTTVLDKFKNKQFLSSEQEWDIIDILSKNCRKPLKDKIRSAILYNIYSLVTESYWTRFTVTTNAIVYEPKTKLVAQELKQIRGKILEKVGV